MWSDAHTLLKEGARRGTHRDALARPYEVRCVVVDDERGYARRTVSTFESRQQVTFSRFLETGSEGHVGVRRDPFGSEEGKAVLTSGGFFYLWSMDENQFTILSLLFAIEGTFY